MQATPSVAAFTAFDWLLVLLVLISTALAFRKGIIRVLFSLAGVILGVIIASWNYLALAIELHRWITSFRSAPVFAFFVLFLLVAILVAWLAKLIRSAVKAIGLGFLDKLLGAVVGLARGVLLGVVLMMGTTAFFPNAPWMQNSQLVPYFLEGVHAVSFVVPEHFQNQISTGARYLLHETPELFRPHTLKQHM